MFDDSGVKPPSPGAGPSSPTSPSPSSGQASARSADGGSSASAAAASIVTLPTISGPKGGGAIQSIGEKFAANVATGTAGLTVPIATSPGRAGSSLGLALSYDSGVGNGPFGIGWQLSLGSITRKTDRGVPRYVDENETDVFILAGAEDLVPVRDGEKLVERVQGEYRVRRYRPRVEGSFQRIERWIDGQTSEAHWRVTTNSNVTSIFGRSQEARIADPNDKGNVFSWLLEETRDDRGNIVVYEYKRETAEGIDRGRASEANRFERFDSSEPRFLSSAQRYIKRIRYGNDRPNVAAAWHFEVVFDYGEHPDLTPSESRPWGTRRDPFSTHRPGFEVRTYRLCRRVLMFHRFEELGPDPLLVRSTDFTHEERDHLTLLRRAVHVGYLDGERAEFPPLDLSYTLRALHKDVRAVDEGALEGIRGGVDGGAARWVDLNGEGLPGALIAEQRGWHYKANLGEGDLAPPELVRALPSPGDIRGGVQMFTDLASEGHLDLAQFGGTLPGYFGRTPDSGWTAFTPFATLPQIDWRDPNLRFLDVDGDGLTDVLITQDDAIVWYRSLGKQGFEPPNILTRPCDEMRGAAVLFADRSETIFVADMSGDGLSDIVRIRRGEVCYWPNLGHGRFGRKVTMDRSPRFAEDDQFDPRRIRLADVDGSGTADVLYLGTHGVHVYFNESGNSLADAGLLVLPIPHNSGTIHAVDLLGKGTTCLVWSSPLPADSNRPIVYVDLMGGVKPHLLSQFTNGIGAETRLSFAASTEFYLRDKREGRTWLTRLAFPVQVVDRVERYDHIAQSKLVTRYRYHHGFYDGVEREYRGFAFVEAWDAESFKGGAGKGLFPDSIERNDDDLRVPPVLTKTWFHTGAWLEQEPLERALARDYYRGDPSAPVLPTTRVPGVLRGSDAREGARSLHGATLRQEIYSEDDTPESGIPYSVSERAYEIRMLQPVHGEKHGVFFPHAREQLDFAYERKPLDPRISHQLTLSVDDFGNVTEQAAIAYPRRAPGQPEQARLWATASTARFVNHPSLDGWYRLGVPIDDSACELTGLPTDGLFSIEQLKFLLSKAAEIPFEALPTEGRLERRIFHRRRQTYYRNDVSHPLPLGVVESLALPFQTLQGAFTPGLVAKAFGDRLENEVLDREGGYVLSDGLWWSRSGLLLFEPGAFYQATEALDPFGNRSTLRFDASSLLVVETCDAEGNLTHALHDYRVLAARLVSDPNGNRTAVGFDTRGASVRIALMGKEGAHEGDTLEDPTLRFEYDPLAYATSGKPAFAHTFAREEHGAANRWQETYAYSDGSGRVTMQKMQAAPGLALEVSPSGGTSTRHVEHRWVGTGRTVFDNRGNPVKQYEPFFSATPGFETERAIAEWGVTPILRYDPIGRLVRTERPNGTFSKVVFEAWRTEAWDVNDTVLESRWYRMRGSPPPSEHVSRDQPARRAAVLAARSANTPTRTHLDALGRAFLVQEDNADADGLYQTRSVLDVVGNAREVIDARGVRTVAGQEFDMLARILHSRLADAGERRAIDDTVGGPLRAWDARGFEFRNRYDRLRRPTHAFARDADGVERLVTRTVYGESAPDAAAINLRGRIFQVFDGAGVATNSNFDFKGNLVRAERRLMKTISEVVDWRALEDITGPDAIEATASPYLETHPYVTRTSFDALSRVVSQVTPDGSDVRPHYNPSNLIAGLEASVRGGRERKWYARAIEYNARGQRLSVDRGDGIVSKYSYDPETFRLTNLETRRRSGHRLQELAYEYDPVGNIVALEDAVSFGNAQVSASGLYEYDPLYRLTHAEGREHPGQRPSAHDAVDLPLPHSNDLGALARYREEYSYDPVGNILRLAHRPIAYEGRHGGWTRQYEYAADSNRLLVTGTPSADAHERTDRYDYDANGNMIGMTHLGGMRCDYANRLVAVDKGGGGTVAFAYDAAGQRVRKTHVHSDLREERIYLGSFELYRRQQIGSDALVLARETLHLDDGSGRLALVETKTFDRTELVERPQTRVRYPLADQIKSSVLEVDETGSVITYEEYMPYGASAVRASSRSAEVSVKRYRYTGQERDEETGLYYQGARYYAAWLGRWTACDPAGFVDGPNLYCYVGDSPLGSADPSGTDGEPANACDDDRNNPTNYNSFEEYRAGADSPYSTEYLQGRWDETHSRPEPSSPPPGPEYEYDGPSIGPVPPGFVPPAPRPKLAGVYDPETGYYLDSSGGLKQGAKPRRDNTGVLIGAGWGLVATFAPPVAAVYGFLEVSQASSDRDPHMAGVFLLIGAGGGGSPEPIPSPAAQAAGKATWEDFLPEAQKRVAAASEKYGPSDAVAVGPTGGNYGWGECDKFADDLQAQLSSAGQSGTRVTVRPPGKYYALESKKFGKLGGPGGDHIVIESGGMIYDNFRPHGVTPAEFWGDLLEADFLRQHGYVSHTTF